MEIEHLLHCFMSLALSGVILLVIFVTFDDKRHFSYKVSSAFIKNLVVLKSICPFWSGNSILSLNAGEICVYLIFKLYVSVRSINHFMCQNKFFSNIQITKFYHRSFNKFSYFHSCTQ